MQFMGKMGKRALSSILSYYEKYSDGTLRTEDGSTFKIHRVLLSRRSEYFYGLFSFEPNNKPDILLKGFESQTLRQILHYLYTGAAPQLDEKNVRNILIAAEHMMLEDLLEQCRDFVIRGVTPSNCLPMLTTAARYEGLNIFWESSRYVKVHFEELVKSFPEEIEDLPIEVLMELLKDNALNVTSEDTVRMAIDIWVKVDPLNRNRHLPDLSNCIRFEEADLASKVVQDSAVVPNTFCMEVLQDALPIRETSFLQETLNRERRLPKCLHVGGRIECGTFQIYLTYDKELDFWRKLIDVPSFTNIVVPIGKFIYFFYPHENVTQRYDLMDDSLVPLTATSVNRQAYRVVELNGKIYALGGIIDPSDELEDDEVSQNMRAHEHAQNKKKMHISVASERYDPDTETWNPIESAGQIAICSAVNMNGKIYVMGFRYNGPEVDITMVTRVYDPITEVWTTVEPPRVLRTSFSAIAFENRLYVIGGKYDDTDLRSVEEYDPVLGVWVLLPDLPLSYCRTQAMVLAGNITVFDSQECDEHSIWISPPVRWDGEEHTWQKIKSVFSIKSYGILDDPSIVKELVNRSRRSKVQWERNFSSKVSED